MQRLELGAEHVQDNGCSWHLVAAKPFSAPRVYQMLFDEHILGQSLLLL